MAIGNKIRQAFKAFDFGRRWTETYNTRHSGGALSPNATTTLFDIAVGFYCVNGLLITGAAASAQVLPDGINTTGSQCRKVLVSIKQDGAYAFTNGDAAATQGAALKPALPAGSCEVGYIEVPVSFTKGSTAVTSGMCKQTAPHPTRSVVVAQSDLP